MEKIKKPSDKKNIETLEEKFFLPIVGVNRVEKVKKVESEEILTESESNRQKRRAQPQAKSKLLGMIDQKRGKIRK